MSIAVSQLRLRARLEKEDPARLRVKMWCYPYLTWVAIVGMVAILVAMLFIPEQRLPLLLGVVSLGVLLAAYAAKCLWGSKPQFEPIVIERAFEKP